MMNFVQRGATLTVTAPYALTSGAGCRVGNIFGVASYDALIGASAEITLEGAFSFFGHLHTQSNIESALG